MCGGGWGDRWDGLKRSPTQVGPLPSTRDLMRVTESAACAALRVPFLGACLGADKAAALPGLKHIANRGDN